MNKKQKIRVILILIIPFFLVLGTALRNNCSPFDFGKTWGIWLLYLFIVWINLYDKAGYPKNKILEWPLEAFMWVYEIFLYSLAPLLFLGIIWILGDLYIWFQNFSWFIKIPICIVIGMYLRSISKSRYFTYGNKLYVGKISPHLDSEQLKELLSRYGKVKGMKHYQNEGFAYIEMASPEEAKKVKDSLIKDDKDNTLFVVIV